MREPAHHGYFADPFVLSVPGGYVAYGTGPAPARHDGDPPDQVFESLWSSDLRSWESRGPVLRRVATDVGTDYWAPEVAHTDGGYWMYYSVGHGIAGHHLRVARAASPFGPFEDTGVSLTPHERFAIDAHPFHDHDGRWYLFFARDVLDAERPGTHLAVAAMSSMTQLASEPTEALRPNADWQIYQRNRPMHGQRFDWHTLEGPSVAYRNGQYWLTYSGGAWTGSGYAVSWAVGEHPLGPWQHAPDSAQPILASEPGGFSGPGHNSLVTGPDGQDAIAFHAWDAAGQARQLHVHRLSWLPTGPRVGEPLSSTAQPADPARPAHREGLLAGPTVPAQREEHA